MEKKRRFRGFTLIELSLSLAFIGILSVTVVLLIQNTMASYRRGLILNQVNTVGMDLVDEFRMAIQNADSDPVTRMCEIYYDANTQDRTDCVDDHANSFILVTKYGKVTADGKNLGDLPIYGALCTGTYTYVWNSGYFENSENTTRSVSYTASGGTRTTPVTLGIKYDTAMTPKYDNFRLLKVYDDERTVCVNVMHAVNTSPSPNTYVKSTSYQNNRIPNIFYLDSNMLADASINGEGDGVDFLKKTGVNDLVLYDLYVAPPAMSSTRGNLFYAASFILGTRRGGINITTSGNNCRPPSDDLADLDYCAINKFNFAVQAGGSNV